MSASFDILSKLPFPGLRSYDPQESEIYFGREKQLDELLRKLRTNRFLAVVGNPGSGKSSLLKAALYPKLKQGFAGQAGQHWRIAVCKPTSNSIGNLAAQLAQRNVLHADEKMDPNYPSIIETMLRRGGLGIVESYRNSDVPKGNLLIIVDQFDDIFRFSKKNSKNQEDALAFVNLLLNASKQKDVPIYVILSMRSGYIGNCTDFRGLPEAISEGQFLIPKMKAEDFKKVIISPIKSVGANIDAELVNLIVSDMGEDFDELPVLQHLMMRIWDCWVEDCDPSLPIGIQHYEKVGGIKKALSIHAEEAYRVVTPDKKFICERMFRALSEKGSDGIAVRRHATVKEIMQISNASLANVIPVITTFSRNTRLFINAPEAIDIDEETNIFITDESLISKWDRLKNWSDEEHEASELYHRLSEDAALYINSKGGLWADPELTLGLKWYDPQKHDPQNPDRLAPNKEWSQRYNNTYEESIDFLLKSESANSKKEFAEKEDADRKKKTRALIMYLSLGFGVICLILLLLAGIALESARRSAVMAGRKEKEARLAAYQAELAKQDAAGKEFLAQTSAKRAKQERLLAESATRKAIESSEIAQQKSLDARRSETKAMIAFDSAQSAMAKAERERLKALEKEKFAREQKEIADNERLKAIKTKGLSLAQSVAVKSWKIEDPDVQALLAQEAFGINKASEGKNNDAYIYEALYKAFDKLQNVKDNPDFNTLSIPPKGLDHLGAIRSIVVSFKEDEKDKKIYTTGSDGWLLKWNLTNFKNKEDRSSNGRPEELAKNRNDRVYRSMDMSQNGKYLVRGGDEEFIELFDVSKKERILTIDAHRGRRVWALEFFPDGNAIVSAGDDGTIKYSNLKGQVTPIVEGLTNRITSISLSGDGQHLAGAGNTTSVSIWNVKSGQEEFKLDNPYNKQNATAVAVSPAGRYVAVGYQDGAMMIWDMNEFVKKGNDYRPDRFLNHSAKINDLAFSADGSSLLVGSLDKKATLWQVWDKKFEDLNNEKEFPFKDPKYQPIRLEDHEDWVLSVAFSHDGTKALTGCADGKVKIYEVDMMRYSEQICEMVKKNLSNKDWKKYIGTDYNGKDPRDPKNLYIITANGERTPISTCGSDYLQDSDIK